MTAAVMCAALAFAFLAPLGLADIMSDITTSESDEVRALQIKAERFWTPVLNAAKAVQMEKHWQLYADAEKVMKGLPMESDYVRKALQEALDHLKSADSLLLKQSMESSSTASEKLATPSGKSDSFSFFTGGQNFLKSALGRFIDGGRYSEKLVHQVEQRQADILPLLRGAASATGNILSDCRLASKLGFDVRKYDIYNKGVPKTPENAKAMADRIIDAAGETRHHFMASITDMVKGITRDVQEKQEDAAATVTRASLQASFANAAADSSTLPSSAVEIRSSVYSNPAATVVDPSLQFASQLIDV